ncbi:OLC1v1025986C1 [Oldenlandia corymbosa var. corymbosa]|uniref:OLC1v1025986C1 n=1 Tax=Oldenlandia corymbosa var. corymbosa TaxID=529605 RepID=A0AAV1C828_OLDCO|nr:OLC1v1025986C1 [Oldenlandia corymbosa var. corymbosa]
MENYLAMIDGYCEHHAERAYELLLELREATSSTKKKLSDTCGRPSHGRSGAIKKARWVFDNLILRGMSPDVVIYTIMLDGYCKQYQLDEACVLFEDMKRRGITPDVVTYAVLFKGCSRCDSRKDFHSRILWAEMKVKGRKADVICYNVLIKSNNMQVALELFEEMIDNGLVPDVVTYDTLLYGCYKSGCLKTAIKVANEMISKGIELNNWDISNLHQGIFKNKAKKFSYSSQKGEIVRGKS